MKLPGIMQPFLYLGRRLLLAGQHLLFQSGKISRYDGETISPLSVVMDNLAAHAVCFLILMLLVLLRSFSYAWM